MKGKTLRCSTTTCYKKHDCLAWLLKRTARNRVISLQPTGDACDHFRQVECRSSPAIRPEVRRPDRFNPTPQTESRT